MNKTHGSNQLSSNVHLPSLSVLRCFEAAAKHQSFTAAAEELGLTQGAVSRQVKDLEDQIGAALFRREGRGVRLTHAGQRFAKDIAQNLTQLRRSVFQAVAAGEAQNVLTISALPTFATRWLVPRQVDFKQVHADICLVLQTRSEPFDLIEEGVDLAIHFGAPEWPGAQITPLCPEDLVVVAAPELLRQQPDPEHPDMSALPLLHISSRPHLWDAFLKGQSSRVGSKNQSSYFDQFSLVISAAISGLGAAILPTYLIEDELAAGTLVRLASVPNSPNQNYFIATPTAVPNPLAAAFAAWVRKQVTQRV
ncbi:MAG: LysR substrate-binding domain-containing protein [Cognatishimia sp.]